MTSSGVIELYKDKTRPSKPLNTDRIITKAAVPTKTPSIEIPEIRLIALSDFFEKRYRRAIYIDTFKIF
jgi:hypothetical protein